MNVSVVARRLYIFSVISSEYDSRMFKNNLIRRTTSLVTVAIDHSSIAEDVRRLTIEKLALVGVTGSRGIDSGATTA
ncbi:hypothetical protein EVAR_91_1 [Eumeta japonica]|uniref:Uncharacterized protein n=1 Tax=Eumeta variegata TaxID=151549 RepID=A0A4C1S824_EUMVA|nr:hypothetical protein EVAR_91_1 [Eumeta japonica]